MENRVSVITLGVADVTRARSFYEALGWSGESPDGDVVFFQAGGMVLALWGRDKLAEDSAVDGPGGWGGVTLAYNVGSPAEVDVVLAAAAQAGATIGRPGAADLLGWLLGDLHRPRRSSLGGGAQPGLDHRRGRQRALAPMRRRRHPSASSDQPTASTGVTRQGRSMWRERVAQQLQPQLGAPWRAAPTPRRSCDRSAWPRRAPRRPAASSASGPSFGPSHVLTPMLAVTQSEPVDVVQCAAQPVPRWPWPPPDRSRGATGELVATQPADDVGLAGGLTQDAGQELQGAVPAMVPVGVVEGLEIVEVGHNDAEGGVVALRQQ